MKRDSWRWLVLLVATNAALVLIVWALAHSQPLLSDRDYYEAMGQDPFSTDCQRTVMCLRVIVPTLVMRTPLPSEVSWRLWGGLAKTMAGYLVGLASWRLSGRRSAGFLAAVMVQCSFLYAYTSFDPYQPDPEVQLALALVLVSWLWDLRWVAVAIAGLAALLKQSVVLFSSAPALASLVPGRRTHWKRWCAVAGLAWVLTLVANSLMTRHAGWNAMGQGCWQDLVNPTGLSSEEVQRHCGLVGLLLAGGWLPVDIRYVPLSTLLLEAFVSCGFAWVYAALGYRFAADRMRVLVLGSVIPLAALLYSQGSPDRSLGNAVFLAVPLSMVFLSRLPLAAALTGVLTNAALTLKVGLSLKWLPPSPALIVLGALGAGIVLAASIPREQKREPAPLTNPA